MKKHIQFLNGLACLFCATLMSANNSNIVEIKLPKVPEVPKVEAVVPQIKMVITQDGNNSRHTKSTDEIIQEIMKKKEVKFSNHVAPVIVQKLDAKDKVVQAGDITNGKVAAYLHTDYMSVEEVASKLLAAGFNIKSRFKLDKKGNITSIVFTNIALIKAASKPNRGFAATLRATVDKKDKLVSISNPIYILKAFLQSDYDEKLANETLKSLRETFKGAKNSDEMIKFSALENFQFMAGMPKYQDMQIISKGDNTVLLNKARKSKKLVFEQKLENKSVLLGVKLGRRTSKFVKKTGYKNAGLLPYPVLIEEGKVKILDPKYYIAVMYPMLKMSQFMTIATVPGAINKDCDRIFR